MGLKNVFLKISPSPNPPKYIPQSNGNLLLRFHPIQSLTVYISEDRYDEQYYVWSKRI